MSTRDETWRFEINGCGIDCATVEFDKFGFDFFCSKFGHKMVKFIIIFE